MNIKATIFIIDDDLAIRDSLTLMLMQEGFTVSTFENAETFLDSSKRECFGCAIVDIRMKGMDGMQLQEALNKQSIHLPIIFLTGHGDIPLSVRAIKAGAIDFLTKPVTREKLMASIRYALVESDKILYEKSSHKQAQSHLAELTERERDVMALAIQGHSNKEIAKLLGISHRTVEIHKSKIMHKTGANNLLDLVRIAHEGSLN
jgi:FixJ family two-component response regulator